MTQQIKKALLVAPPTGRYIREERCQTPLDGLFTVALRPPIDLLMAAAVMEECGVEAIVRDYPALEGNWDNLQQDLAQFQPDALVLSVTTPTLAADARAATLAKALNSAAVTIAKGAHFLHADVNVLHAYPMLDVVLRGEYEETLADLCRGKDWLTIPGLMARHQGCAFDTGARPAVADLDKLPLPARHLIDNRLYRRPDLNTPQTTVLVSRGCPYRCSFCLAPQISGNTVRLRSPENILVELQTCINQFGLRDFLFRSDLFTSNRDWVLRLCDLIIHHDLKIRWCCNSRADTLQGDVLRRMKQAGCWLVAFGLESGSDTLLRDMHKGMSKEQARFAINLCKSEKVKSSVYFLIGLPGETEETFAETVAFAQFLGPDFVEFFYAYPFEGTAFYDEAVRDGLLAARTYPTRGYNLPSLPTRALALTRLEQMRREAIRQYYLRPAVIWRTLMGTRSPRTALNYFRFGIKQLGDLVTGS